MIFTARLTIAVLWITLGMILWTDITAYSATWHLEGWPTLLLRAVFYTATTAALIFTSSLLWPWGRTAQTPQKNRSPWSY